MEKTKNVKNLKKFEKSHRSIIQESSVILDGIKVKNKRQKRENEESIIEATRNTQDELTSIKKMNEILKKEIEAHKGAPKNPATGTGSSTAAQQKMDSLYLSVIQQTENNMTTLKKKTMVDTIRKYNQRVSKKITEFREDNMELLEQRRRYEETFDNETYMAGLGADEIVHRQFILNVISYYQSMNDQLKEIIDLKNQVNNNEGKIAVLKALLGENLPDGQSSKEKPEASPSIKTPMAKKDATMSPKLPAEISTGASAETPTISELEALIEAAETEKARLTNSLSTTITRNKTLTSELQKTNDINKAKKLEDIEKLITEQHKEIEDIKQEIQLLSAH